VPEVKIGESRVAGFQEKNFQAGAVSIHYAEGPPNGPALVLLHGLARDWKSFSVLLPELSSRFHVFALDMRGHGASSRVPRGYRIPDYAHDVSAFLKQVVPSGAAIFGHSLGAEAGMCVAATPDSRVSALILGDPVISPENFARSMYDPLFLQLHKLMLRDRSDNGSDKELSQEELARGIGKIEIRVSGFDETLRIEDLPGNTGPVLLEWARCAMQTDPETLAMTLDGSSFAGWGPGQILPQISCPTLLLQGNPELDALLSDDDVKLALRLLPNARHVKFSLLGHALFMQQPKPVLHALTSFLSSLGRGGA
jgi:pimeloyl-ACP methyl ester carboxylesterase